MTNEKVISSIDTVRNFVLELREVAGGAKGPNVRLEPRDEVIQGIADIGLTQAQAKAEVAGLKISNYSNGPEVDKDLVNAEGEFCWVFTKKIMNKNAYIKVKIVKKNCCFVKCLSFHPAKFPMAAAFSVGEVEEFKRKLEESENEK